MSENYLLAIQILHCLWTTWSLFGYVNCDFTFGCGKKYFQSFLFCHLDRVLRNRLTEHPFPEFWDMIPRVFMATAQILLKIFWWCLNLKNAAVVAGDHCGWFLGFRNFSPFSFALLRFLLSLSYFCWTTTGGNDDNFALEQKKNSYKNTHTHTYILGGLMLDLPEWNQDSFADLARLLSEFFRDLDVVPSDVVVGLLLLRRLQRLEQCSIVKQVRITYFLH